MYNFLRLLDPNSGKCCAAMDVNFYFFDYYCYFCMSESILILKSPSGDNSQVRDDSSVFVASSLPSFFETYCHQGSPSSPISLNFPFGLNPLWEQSTMLHFPLIMQAPQWTFHHTFKIHPLHQPDFFLYCLMQALLCGKSLDLQVCDPFRF